MKKGLVVAVLVALGGLVVGNSIWGQQPPSGGSGANRAVNAPPTGGGFADYPGLLAREPVGFPGQGYDGSARSEVARLVTQLRDSDDDQKADLTKELQAAIDKYFDDDMKARETELTKLEERLTKLRSQMERRRKAKAEIIALQLKVLVNEADGLGFSGASFQDPAAVWTPFMNRGNFGGGVGFGVPGNVPASAEPARTKAAPRK